MGNYSMHSYFQNMPKVGKSVTSSNAENRELFKEVEAQIHALIEEAVAYGRSDESLNKSGQMTAKQRIEELIDEGTWCPLNTIFNPEENPDGTTGILKGLGRIEGKWAVIIASDNKKLAGAWIPGQAENLLRGSDTAKRLGIPLVYILNCSGVKLDVQEKVYPNRRGGGTPFFRNAELAQMGIPVIVGIYGTNPAGGGYHSISPTILIAHKDANMAVGGAGILGGMNPKGYIDQEGAEQIIEANILNAKKIDKNQNITGLEPKKDPFKTVKIFDTEEIELEKFSVNVLQIKEGNLFCEVLSGIYNEIDKLEKVNFGNEIDFEQGINFNIVSTEYSLKENLKMGYKKSFGMKELIDSLDDKVENIINFETQKKREKDSYNIKGFYEFLKKIFDTFKNRDNNISLIRIGKYTGFNDKTINLVTTEPIGNSRTVFDANHYPIGWALIKVEEVDI